MRKMRKGAVNRMFDVNKVVKGLECCQYSSKSHCDGCPYIYGDSINNCTSDLATDVLTMLKKQDSLIENARSQGWSDGYDEREREYQEDI